MKLAVHITTMNRPDTLLATLRAAVALSAPDVETALTVVDNGSFIEACQILGKLEASGVHVIRNTTNLGLSRAVNQGLVAGYASGADVLIHLDDDALIRTQDWDRVFASYFAHPRVGLVVTNPAGVGIPKGGSATVRFGEEAFAVVSGGSEALLEGSPEGRRADSRPIGNLFGYIPTGPPYREVSWGLGMCWAIRREVYEKTGGYDPALLHQNECDLALRVRLAGYEVAGIDTVDVLHNDPGGPRSDLSLAREHLGCVQFRDKWVKYFDGRDAGYGAMPLSLMPHWPPDADFLRRYAEHHGVDLNPPPGVLPELGPGATLGLPAETLRVSGEHDGQLLDVAGTTFLVHRSLRNDHAHWARGDAYLVDRQKAIERWAQLTGEVYAGYDWGDHLKPKEVS